MSSVAGALAGFAWLVSIGCRTAAPAASVQPAAPGAPPAHEEGWQYRIRAGDELAVKLFYHPSLNEQITVRPDGRISLQLVGEVVAAGETAEKLSEQLKARYSESLESPEVSVIVKTFAGERVFVAGEVVRPGEQALVGRTTVLQAIAQCQGFKDSARLTQVLIIRRNPDFSPSVMQVNLQKVVHGKDLANDVLLAPYDVVFVPRSTIANVNKFVREFITNNLPFDFGFRIDLYKSN
jgi:protein involved in polysaccharide export with SLBB domain